MEENNINLQKSNEGYIKKRGWKLFLIRLFYMFALTMSLTYTISRFLGGGILASLQITSIIFTLLPVLFIIGFALAMWRFWYSIPWFILATLAVNYGIFGGISDVIGLSAIEVPIFLGVTFVVFGVEKGFSAIPQKWLRVILALLPFVIMLLTIFSTYFR